METISKDQKKGMEVDSNMTLLWELGDRVMRDLRQENTGKPSWRIHEIVMRWFMGVPT